MPSFSLLGQLNRLTHGKVHPLKSPKRNHPSELWVPEADARGSLLTSLLTASPSNPRLRVSRLDGGVLQVPSKLPCEDHISPLVSGKNHFGSDKLSGCGAGGDCFVYIMGSQKISAAAAAAFDISVVFGWGKPLQPSRIY